MTDIIFNNGNQIAGRYEIKAFIAEGGMQQVYMAFDQRLNRTVALKTPINDSAHKRFKDSAVLSARITHPNIAKALDFFEFEDRQFLVEEYIGGMNLRERYSRDYNYLDPFFACYFIHQLARGVAASHHAKVFHRDLKPSNIMVSNEPLPNVVKITDFGIAKMAQQIIEDVIKTSNEDEKTLAMETSKTVKGAIPYMAQELLQNNDPGLPADIWAIGAIGYELLTGKKPYGDGLKAVAGAISKQLPPQPVLQNSDLEFQHFNDELWGIISKCFEFEPTKRITADTLVQKLGELSYSCIPRSEGIISFYGGGPAGSLGTIRDGNSSEIFFHRKSVYGPKPQVGQRVLFTAFAGSPNPRAHPVLPLKAL